MDIQENFSRFYGRIKDCITADVCMKNFQSQHLKISYLRHTSGHLTKEHANPVNFMGENNIPA